MKISIVIPALNEADHIERAVKSGWHGGADEIVVGVGDSSDGTTELAVAAGAIVVPSEVGRAAQQNAAAQRASGDVLLFLHADNWLSGPAIPQLRSALAGNGVSAGAFRQRIQASGWTYRMLEQGNAARVRWLRMAYGDQAIFMRRALFEQLGGFPAEPLMEDVMLMNQLRRHGVRPLLLPGPVYVSARRWKRNGTVRQTLRNWSLLAAFCAGVPPRKLARRYPVAGEAVASRS